MIREDDRAYPSDELARGLTKLELLSAMMAQGLAGNPDITQLADTKIAASAVSLARALIAELNNVQKG